jgi:hypothetical protein
MLRMDLESARAVHTKDHLLLDARDGHEEEREYGACIRAGRGRSEKWRRPATR